MSSLYFGTDVFCALEARAPEFDGALTLRPPTLRPLMTSTQTLKPQNLTTQKRLDHVTLSPKSGRIVRPTKIVTL
jgi:hypothetical protein